MAAMSCVRWLVTASSSTDAQAESVSHKNRSVEGGGLPASSSRASTATTGSRDDRHAVSPQSAAKTT